MDNNENPFKSPAEWFHTLGTHFTEAQFIFQLNQCGVIEYLKENPYVTAKNIAETLALQEEPLKVSLDYLSRISALLKKNEKEEYFFSEFGLSVLDRYKRVDNDSTSYNLLDVRVGAYGDVWSQLGAMVRGQKIYGKDFKRKGEFANQGVYVLGQKIANSIIDIINKNHYEQVVELGLNSGSLIQINQVCKGVQTIGVDKKKEALDIYDNLFDEKKIHSRNLVKEDIYDVSSWIKHLDPSKKTLIYSLHFHEFLVAGNQALTGFFKQIKDFKLDIEILMIEVPKIPEQEKNQVTEVKWMYSASDILIHELIGIGKILSEKEWLNLAADAGLKWIETTDTEAFAFKAIRFK